MSRGELTTPSLLGGKRRGEYASAPKCQESDAAEPCPRTSVRQRRGHGKTATATTHDQVVCRGSAHSVSKGPWRDSNNKQGVRGFKILRLHPRSILQILESWEVFSTVRGLVPWYVLVDNCCRRSHFRHSKFWATFLNPVMSHWRCGLGFALGVET